MTVRIHLVKVEIVHGTSSGADLRPSDDGAKVHLEVLGTGGEPIPISYHIRPFRSLDEAVEEARKQLLAFAQELASQAVNPLVRIPGNP